MLVHMREHGDGLVYNGGTVQGSHDAYDIGPNAIVYAARHRLTGDATGGFQWSVCYHLVLRLGGAITDYQ